MCGIAGTTGVDAELRTAAMLPLLRHRGPDDSGVYADADARVAIGATRLSIIDVAGGHQPLANEDGSIHCVLNGEIYNFRSLRDRLAGKGHVFRTQTDSEVLVHLYEEYGPDLVHALDGMFAFALWDGRLRTLVLARDRFGEKPLFVHQSNGRLTFASELTALRRGTEGALELDPESLDLFFTLGYVPGPPTIYVGAELLPPGTVATWHEGEELQRSRYWAPPVYATEASTDERGVVEEMASLVGRAVESRMVSDVPLGVFLSGGADSSLIAAHAAAVAGPDLRTFSVDYDIGAVSETVQAREVAAAIGTQHHAFTLTQDAVGTHAPRRLAALDQPIADPAFVALSALAEYARRHVTVALSGEGADEIFGGYPRYRWLSRFADGNGASLLGTALRRAPSAWPRAGRLARSLTERTLEAAQLRWVADSRLSQRAALLGPRLEEQRRLSLSAAIGRRIAASEESSAGFLMRLDASIWLPDDVLAKSDRSSMLASLESRAPFLSRELAEFAASIPTGFHLSGGGKRLVRSALARILPPAASRRRKVAFRVPLAEWLRGPLRPTLEAQLDDSWVYREGWFDLAATRNLVRRHLAGESDHADVLWPLFTLGCWSPA